jgi:hypothetical protein
MKFHGTLLRSVLLLSLAGLLITACSDDDNSIDPGGLTVTFPTGTGTVWVYDDYEDTTNTEAGYNKIGTITETLVGTNSVGGRVAMLHQNSFQPDDSNMEPTIDTTLYNVENGDLFIYVASPAELLGGADLPINIDDINFTAGWYPFLRVTSAPGSTYTIIENQSFATQVPLGDTPIDATVTFSVRGEVKENAQIEANNTTYTTRHIALIVDIKISAGIIQTSTDVTLDYWIADGVGIVKDETGAVEIPNIPIPISRFRQNLVSFTQP